MGVRAELFNMVRKATPAEVTAAYHDQRQRQLPLDRRRPREQPGPLTKQRWINTYFERHNWLTANGGNNVRAFAAAIAYRHTLHRVMDVYRCTEARAIAFLKWCGLEIGVYPPLLGQRSGLLSRAPPV